MDAKEERPAWGGLSRIRRTLAAFFRDPRVEVLVAVLILASVLEIVYTAILPPKDPLHPILIHIGEAFTILFAIELSLRYIASRSRVEFLREFWLDVLAVLPLLRPLRFLRFLRLVRLFRAGIVVHRHTQYLTASLFRVSGEYVLLGIFLLTSLVLGAVGLKQLEGGHVPAFSDLGSSFWWSLFSMAAGEPVGPLPRTPLGKTLALFVVFSGMTLFAMFTGIMSAVMVQRLKKRMDTPDIDLEELTGHTIVCGWNRTGNILLQELQHDTQFSEKPIVVIAEFEAEASIDFTDLRRELIYVLRGDYTRVSVLEQANISRASSAILLADKVISRSDQDRDARTVLAALTIEKLAPGVFTCVELLNAENESHLRMAGVEEVVINDVFGASVLAVSCLHRGMGNVVRELVNNQLGNNFFKCPVPGHWAGHELALVYEPVKTACDAILLGVENGGVIQVNPTLTYRIQEGDHLVLISDHAPDLDRVPFPSPE